MPGQIELVANSVESQESPANLTAKAIATTQQVCHVKELEEDAWYREWVSRNTIRHERAKAAGAY
jgi:hypothetical protein